MKRVVAILTPLHRYLGLGFCLVFVAWFASGLVMIYARMPQYAPAERAARLAPLDPPAIRLTPAEALTHAQLGVTPQRIRLTTLGSRPVYRFGVGGDVVTVYADDGTVLDPLTADAALGVVRTAFPEQRRTAHLLETIDRPDQWTIEAPFGSTGPLHVVALGDSAATNVYVASNTGEIVLKTDRSSRFWGYAGPVMHWFYFTPFRVHGALWASVIVYGSLAGCCVCVLGLVIGTYRYWQARRRREPQDSALLASPYSGWLRWHHYAGLVFGVVTLTWVFSGMLSMEPWGVSQDNGPDAGQVMAIRGNGVDTARFAVPPALAIDALRARFAPKELDLIQFMGAPFYRAEGVYSRRTLLVTAEGVPAVKDGFSQTELLAAASAAMPRATPSDVTWLTRYDGYYYDRTDGRPLPVLRVKYSDDAGSWLYLDASDGSLVQRETSRGRRVRWLYHGLHSLDFPGLYQAGWIWAAVIVTLCTGGLLLSLTSAIVGWRWLRGTRAANRAANLTT